MEPVEHPRGYVLPDEDAANELLRIEAELLRSEGIDPAWPGFSDQRHDSESQD